MGIRAWRAAKPRKRAARTGDFAGYLDRNLPGSFRLAAVVLGDPIGAQEVAHGAALAAWLTSSEWPVKNLDAALKRRFEADCCTALAVDAATASQRTGTDDASESTDSALEAALRTIAPKDRLALARELGPSGDEVDSTSERSPHRLSRRASRAVDLLRRRVGDTPTHGDAPMPGAATMAATVEDRLRALYAARDPGGVAPLQLRLWLQRSLIEAEDAAAERDKAAEVSGWSFVINGFLALLVLSLVVGVGSVLTMRSSPAAGADPVGDPSSPLTMTTVVTVQRNIDSPNVHVAATQKALLATFGSLTDWHLSDQQCRADVIGLVDPAGQAQWLGQRVGHVESIAGDPYSPSAYASGPGPYCQLGQYSTGDGGQTWSEGSLPAGATTSPGWLAFDPGRAGTLLAFDAGVLSSSPDAGRTWTSRTCAVVPIGFDQTGRLVGWSAGHLLESTDEGVTWLETGPGPADRPSVGAATAAGTLLGTPHGLWWYPLTATPSLIQPGAVYSIASLGGAAVVLGADAAGHPWLGTVDDSQPGVSLADLPPDLASLTISGGQIAASDAGAIVALSGASSAIAFATFAR